MILYILFYFIFCYIRVIFPTSGIPLPTSSRLEFSATIPLRSEYTPLEKVTFLAHPGKILAITGKANFDKSGIIQVRKKEKKTKKELVKNYLL
jgi:hypothetical protein